MKHFFLQTPIFYIKYFITKIQCVSIILVNIYPNVEITEKRQFNEL